MQTREFDANEKIAMGFRASGRLATAVHTLADRHGQSASTWLAGLVAKSVAAEIGVPVETLLPSVPAAESEAAIAIARLESTIRDAHAALAGLRSRRTRSGVIAAVR